MSDGFLQYLKDTDEYYENPYDTPINDIEAYIKSNLGYFEALLDTDGKLYEAPNGHTEGLIYMAAVKKNMKRSELYQTCPPEYYHDMINWGILVSDGVMPLWSDFYIGTPNEPQQLTINKLLSYNLKLRQA